MMGWENRGNLLFSFLLQADKNANQEKRKSRLRPAQSAFIFNQFLENPFSSIHRPILQWIAS